MALDRASVDDKITQVGKQLLGTVLGDDELEEVGGIVDELYVRYTSALSSSDPVRWTYSRPGLAGDEDVVCQKAEKEGNVGLSTNINHVRLCLWYCPSSALYAP